MPICGNCRQNSDFYEHDGLFYCLKCDTQSEVMQVLEKEYNVMKLDFTHSYRTTKKKLEDKEPKTNASHKKRSWRSLELYQVIIKSQVTTLIAMGFPKKLDEIVMQLWFRIISQSRLGFCQTPVFPGPNGKISEGDKPGEDTNMKVSSVHLNLWDCVALMYLALRLLDEPVLLSDLIRWVREGHLPLRATADILPEHISKNLSAKDISTFSNPVLSMIDPHKLFKQCRDLSERIGGIPSSITQIDINFLIARMTCTLNLPVELCHLTHHLFDRVQPSLDTTSNSKKRNPHLDRSNLSECKALAYIIVSLKLLFELDDVREHSLSKMTQRLQSLFPVRLFNWSTWVEAQKLRSSENISQEGRVRQTSDIQKVQNMAGFVRNFTRTYKTEHVNKHLHVRKHRHDGNQVYLKEFQRPFHALQEESISNKDQEEGPGPSSFPMMRPVETTILSKESCTDTTVMTNSSRNDQVADPPVPKTVWLPRHYMLHEDFSKHTLRHLTNLQELCEEHIVAPDIVGGILDATEGLTVGRGGKSSSRESSPMKRGSRGETVGDARDHSGKWTEDVLGRISQDRRYVTYPKIAESKFVTFENVTDCFHASMGWLLERCCQLAETSPRLLYTYVYNVEEALFKLK